LTALVLVLPKTISAIKNLFPLSILFQVGRSVFLRLNLISALFACLPVGWVAHWFIL